MTLAAFARCCRSVPPAAAWLSLLVLAAATGGVASAQSPVPADKASRAVNHGDPGKGKRGTLTVEVLLVDPDSKQQHAAKALVRIEGAEDSQETNDKGRVKLSGIPTGTVTLQIMPAGLNLCRLQDVPVTGPDQVVSVLVEKSPTGKCARQE
jgi:hypothetical protein